MENHPFRIAVETHNSLESVAHLLDPDIIFFSPLAITPIVGRDLVLTVLQNVLPTIQNIRCIEELRQDNKTVLVWAGEIDGYPIHGVDIITHGSDGKVKEIKLMARPFPVMKLLYENVIQRIKLILPDVILDIN
ncbi:MAG: hypothetical protein C6Y22_24185 [Hapalosiphonaceae cyanobacterium JJU2]|nr:MAG: hypothetical protein C6Y22_24185 [Hapalosiphonaceae cyanobacterium JJU2]